MTRIILFAFFILSFSVYDANAQSNNKDFVQMCNEGKRLMKQNQYSAAYRIYDGAEGFAITSSDKAEIARLQKQLRDSVQTTYQRGIALIQKARNASTYSSAIQELKKLVPVENLNVPQVFSWLGTAYERINEPYGAIEQYAQGVNHEERFSAMRLAELLQKHKTVSQDSLVNLYEYAATENKGAYETLGDMFISTSPQRAYNYYKKADSQRAKYQMATLLLTNRVSSNDNPIHILQELSNDNYADALFYLGMLYFYAESGDRVKRDRVKGRALISKARDLGHQEAKRIWYNL